jgi:uncharacterized protein with PQ loop repeat
MTTIETKWILNHQEMIRKNQQLKAKKMTTVGFVIFTIFMIGFCLFVIFFGVIN